MGISMSSQCNTVRKLFVFLLTLYNIFWSNHLLESFSLCGIIFGLKIAVDCTIFQIFSDFFYVLANFFRVQFSIPQFKGNQVVKVNLNSVHCNVPVIKMAIFHVVTCRSHDNYFC